MKSFIPKLLNSLFLLGVVVCCSLEKKPSNAPHEYSNSIGMKMIIVPSGYLSSQKKGIESFYMSATEITNSQFEKFHLGHKKQRDKYSPGDDHPVIWVSFDDAIAFVKWLSKKEKLPYAIPSEAQWQWAAQGAHRGYLFATDNGEISHDKANYFGIGGKDEYVFTSPVGSLPPNPLGLYDMSGNVWEWCQDWYDKKRTFHRIWIKPKLFNIDLRIPFIWYCLRKERRILRGGSYIHEKEVQYTTLRNAHKPWEGTASYGFRVILPAKALKGNK